MVTEPTTRGWSRPIRPIRPIPLRTGRLAGGCARPVLSPGALSDALEMPILGELRDEGPRLGGGALGAQALVGVVSRMRATAA